MGINLGQCGSIYRTTSGEVIGAGDKVRVNSLHVISGGGGGAVIQLRNGGAGGTIWIKETGTTGTGASFNYGETGVLFTNGCYVDVDANTVSVLITAYKEVK